MSISKRQSMGWDNMLHLMEYRTFPERKTAYTARDERYSSVYPYLPNCWDLRFPVINAPVDSWNIETMNPALRWGGPRGPPSSQASSLCLPRTPLPPLRNIWDFGRKKVSGISPYLEGLSTESIYSKRHTQFEVHEGEVIYLWVISPNTLYSTECW